MNVRRVAGAHATVELDTELTPELIEEGDEREMARAVAEARKSEGYQQGDAVEVLEGGGPHSVELSRGTVAFTLRGAVSKSSTQDT